MCRCNLQRLAAPIKTAGDRRNFSRFHGSVDGSSALTGCLVDVEDIAVGLVRVGFV